MEKQTSEEEMGRLVGSFSVRGLARRSFIEGAASTMDLRGDTRRQYRFAPSSTMADVGALADDWRVVSNDLEGAIRQGRSRKHVE